MFKLADGLKIEHARNRFFIICESDQQVIILKQREAELLDMLTKKEIEDVNSKIREEYVGDNIETDIKDFYEKMITLGVLKRN